jgi:(E)-4-hydroxy-3-methylbut-2-enyl-diphosphate synthase
MINRKATKKVKIGNFSIGADSPIAVQSMTNLPLEKVSATISQINALQVRGAHLVRVAVPTLDESKYLKEILGNVNLPICADIHFDYKIALAAIEAGIHKIRINPGNIGSAERTREVVSAASQAGIPIRIGVNGGSIDKKKYPIVTPEALVDSAMQHVHILEELNFENIVISIKSSDILQTIEANKLLAAKRDYPIHVGLTEAGYGEACIVQSSMAIGALLMEGIGDTIRVSMTGDPLQEIDIAYEILKSINAVNWGVKIISCPTCGRTDTTIDLLKIASTLDKEINSVFVEKLKEQKRTVSVAVMGCEVNGPGEASHADVGVAGARNGSFLLFAKGEIVKKISEADVVKEVAEQIDQLLD